MTTKALDAVSVVPSPLSEGRDNLQVLKLFLNLNVLFRNAILSDMPPLPFHPFQVDYFCTSQ